jgi:branched-chain amino acid transport system ATP-binding protein
MSTPLLVVENLTVRYGAITALHGVSLHVNQGEVVTLIGSNGAGKTTLLRAVSGLLAHSGGSVFFLSRRTTGMLPNEIVRMGMSHSPEGRQVFPGMTVMENLQLGAFQRSDRGGIKADLERIFGMFPVLAERRGQKSGTLSGGEQQMLAMGRALMARPKLLLLDEPSLGLAPLIVRKIFSIIREISTTAGPGGQPTTIFLVEQNAHMALTVATRGYVMQTGRILMENSAATLLADPAVKSAYLGG